MTLAMPRAERSRPRGKAAEGEDEHEPAAVGVGTPAGGSAEDGEEERDAQDADGEGCCVPVVRSLRVSPLHLAVGREHGVDDDAGDGDVEPDGEGPAGEFAVGGGSDR